MPTIQTQVAAVAREIQGKAVSAGANGYTHARRFKANDLGWTWPFVDIDGLTDAPALPQYCYTDCSGFANVVLAAVSPVHQARVAAQRAAAGCNLTGVQAWNDDATATVAVEVEEATSAWPRAWVIQRYFAACPTDPLAAQKEGWQRIPKIADLQAGDMLAWSLGIFANPAGGQQQPALIPKSLKDTDDTGHVVVLVGNPVPVTDEAVRNYLGVSKGYPGAGTTIYALSCIDASSVPHFENAVQIQPTPAQPWRPPMPDSRYAMTQAPWSYANPDPAKLPSGLTMEAFLKPGKTMPAPGTPDWETAFRRGGAGFGTLFVAVNAAGQATQIRHNMAGPYRPNTVTEADNVAVAFAAARPLAQMEIATGKLLKVENGTRPEAVVQTRRVPVLLSGAGTIEVRGGGCLRLDPGNTLSGTVRVISGQVVLAGAGAAGTAVLQMSTDGPGIITIMQSALVNGALPNTVSNMTKPATATEARRRLRFPDIPFVAGATALWKTVNGASWLEVKSGATTVKLTLTWGTTPSNPLFEVVADTEVGTPGYNAAQPGLIVSRLP